MKIARYKTYLTMIENSVGSKMFRTLYMTDEKGKTKDVLRKGDISCAVYVSSILVLNKFLPEVKARVVGVEEELLKHGWTELRTTNPKEIPVGAVIIWEQRKFKSGEEHEHIGFYMGKKKAICNSPEKASPVKTNYIWKGRPIIKVLWKDGLDK